jgi:hypothetical protein
VAVKNTGITLLGVVVAIAAFVAGTIWSASLHDKVDRITRATEAWSASYNAVNDKEIDLKQGPASDLAGITATLKHRVEDAHRLEDAELLLMRAGTGNLADNEASIAITQRQHANEQQGASVDSADRAIALDKEANRLLDELKVRGVLRDSEALKNKQTADTMETYIKYAGYALTILGFIIAAVAQLTGKSA